MIHKYLKEISLRKTAYENSMYIGIYVKLYIFELKFILIFKVSGRKQSFLTLVPEIL